jgi:hypothetical protein
LAPTLKSRNVSRKPQAKIYIDHIWGRARNLTRRDAGILTAKKGKMMHRIHGNSARRLETVRKTALLCLL